MINKRGLIIKPYWLNEIFNNGKVWEMRSARTNIRGRIGLIESGSGLIVGECNLVNCFEKFEGIEGYKYHKISDSRLLEKYRYAWVLSEAKKYDTPIPYDHPIGAVIWVKL